MTPIPRFALRARVADWQARGVISSETAQALAADIDGAETGARADGNGFQRFIMLAGIACLAFAAISFVAANWEDLPRILRLALIATALWSAWIGGLVSDRRGHPWLAEGLYFLASVIFGAGLALVAQLYHIQGSAPEFLFAWCLGVLIAAIATGSRLTLILGVTLLVIWHLFARDHFTVGSGADLNPMFLPLWLGFAAIGWWIRGIVPVLTLAIAMAVWWATALDVLLPQGAQLPALMLSALLLLIASLAAMARPALHTAASVCLHAVAVTVMFLTLLDYVDGGSSGAADHPLVWLLGALGVASAVGLGLALRSRAATLAYDLFVAAIAVLLALLAHVLIRDGLLQAAYLLALAIWLTRMGYRHALPTVRFIGMGGFLVALMVIYGETVGSLIGTAGFYLGAGLILLIGAWASTRLHGFGPGKDGGGGT